MRLTIVITASLVQLACGSGAGPATPAESAGEARGDESAGADAPEVPIAEVPIAEVPMAEVPFLAAQIRDATPAGRTYVFRFEEDGSSRYERWVFERVDAAGYSSTSTPVDAEGQPIGASERSDGTWSELEGHAHFPADRTTITNAMLTIPLGAVRCQLYTVTSEQDGRPVVSRFWFATDLPGAPIRMVREIDGEPVVTMMLVDHEPPIPAR